MGLLEQIRLNKARNGKISLKDCAVRDTFNEKFVEACIQGNGAEEFEYASEWLRTDADFILRMIKDYPEVIRYIDDIVIDRYKNEIGILAEKEMDKFFFLTLCCKKNLRVFRYLDDENATRYMNAVKREEIIKGEYRGEKQEIALQYDDFIVDRLLNIRYDIIKLSNACKF